jgi:DNA (cytosine-5)-methyltransferase 1
MTVKVRSSVIDLFAGVGGMSLGAARAGFDVRAAVELDSIAVATHAVNFPKSTHLDWDIGNVTGAALMKAAGLKAGQLDGLIGGPPCQGFSDIGKKAVYESP